MDNSFFSTQDLQGTLEQLQSKLKEIEEKKRNLIADNKHEEVARIRDLELKLIEAIDRKKNIK